MDGYFSLENEIRTSTRMDQSLTSGKAPVARWQRKVLETSATAANSSLINVSNSQKFGGNLSLSLNPGGKRLNDSAGLLKTPSKTPKKSPSRFDATTPNKRTPSRSDGADRFIPSRTGTDFETAKFLLRKAALEEEQGSSVSNTMSPSQRDFRKQMSESLHGREAVESSRILSFRSKPPVDQCNSSNRLKVLYSNSKSPAASKRTTRHIPQAPDRVLDAPELVNDYYLSLLDWSVDNFLAVALGSNIYLWNAASGSIRQLLDLPDPEDHVCSVKWAKEGNILAVGNTTGDIALWDVESMRKLRIMNGHTDRVGSLSWNPASPYILSSGSRSGDIHHHDVRVASHRVGALNNGHAQEVCGLAWSPDGRMLASGGNDNVLNIWAASNNATVTETSPKFSLTDHQAAVKALAWCPWQPSVLASGGGTADRMIKIWNCNSGALLNSIDTKSQVCSLLWASEYKELVSAHGYANNEITIWKYPAMTKTAELLGHSERVLQLSLSPDGSTVVSAGADETLRLWKCFLPDPNKKKMAAKAKTGGGSALKSSIR